MARVREFQYLEATSVEEACAWLREYGGAKVFAGGLALTILMKQHLFEPTCLINIKTIPGLDRIDYDAATGLRIGPLARHQWIAESATIAAHYPILAEAAGHVASLPIRRMGTVGGSLSHADPATDMAAALIAAGARLHLRSSDGERTLPIEEFFLDAHETQLQPDELLTGISVAAELAGRSGAHEKLRKNATDIPIVAVSVTVALQDGVLREARIGLAAAAPTPMRCPAAEALLRGAAPTAASIAAAAAQAAREARPISDLRASADYRRKMVRVLARRALRRAVAAAGLPIPE
ncbi:MAG: xanthine dehydrogenase family protein subunit M [Candidatus Tectomicrobia bacterium]|nr:xanthine dehydrogenase family protein subunit M [Candidatus Tectomicrobia bacterium]